MRGPRRLVVAALVVIAAGLAVSGFALAADHTVTLTTSGPQPPKLTVALGDKVTLVNGTTTPRELTSETEGFGPMTLPAGGTYEYVATDPGNIAYRFGSGRTDRGSITVTQDGSIKLSAKVQVVTVGDTFALSGIATPGGFPVVIEGRARPGTDWSQVGTVTPAPDGAFDLVVKPVTSTQYRASLFEGVLRSSRVMIRVKPRVRLFAIARKSRTGRTVKLRASVAPRDAATRITLTTYDAQRKAWRRVSTQRLRNGRAVIPWEVAQGRSRLRLSIGRRYIKPGLVTNVSNAIVFTGVGGSSEPTRERPTRDRNRDRNDR